MIPRERRIMGIGHRGRPPSSVPRDELRRRWRRRYEENLEQRGFRWFGFRATVEDANAFDELCVTTGLSRSALFARLLARYRGAHQAWPRPLPEPNAAVKARNHQATPKALPAEEPAPRQLVFGV